MQTTLSPKTHLFISFSQHIPYTTSFCVQSLNHTISTFDLMRFAMILTDLHWAPWSGSPTDSLEPKTETYLSSVGQVTHSYFTVEPWPDRPCPDCHIFADRGCHLIPNRVCESVHRCVAPCRLFPCYIPPTTRHEGKLPRSCLGGNHHTCNRDRALN